MARYDYNRKVRLKGAYGEVEVSCNDSKSDGYGMSPMKTDELIEQAIKGYAALAEQQSPAEKG